MSVILDQYGMTPLQLFESYRPYWYQQNAIKDFHDKGSKQRQIWRWSRRTGKDYNGLHIMVDEAVTHPGRIYHYAFPFMTWGRQIFWEGRDDEGIPLKEYIPREFLKPGAHAFNEKYLEVRFNNDSIIRVVGIDNPDSMVGQNARGVFFSEYAVAHPERAHLAWTKTYLPMLQKNDGWAIFASTTRTEGKHYKNLWDSSEKDQDRWFRSKIDIETCQIFSRKRVNEILKEARVDGMSEKDILEEYYVQFNVIDDDTYWGVQLLEARHQGRITQVPYNAMYPVTATYDVGNDGTVVWFIQRTPQGSYNIIDYLEETGLGIDEIINMVRDKPFPVDTHLAPHDVAQRSRIFTGATIKNTASMMGVHMDIVEKLPKKQQIDAGRRTIRLCYFDEVKCEAGIDHMERYKGNVINPTKIMKAHTHACDAFQIFAVGKEQYDLSYFKDDDYDEDRQQFSNHEFDVFA
jgi:phage terminase large subunit